MACNCAAACAQDAPWQQYNGLTAVEIPFANGPISAGYVPEVWLKLPGSAPRRFGMDTGSTGIVVAAEHYTPGPGDVAGGPGRLVYNSSGRILNGTYYTTDVVIQRDGNTPLATARVQVLRVTSIACLERARDCRPEQNPRDVAFMGIGFDRESAQGTEAGVSRNAFTSLVSLASGAPLSSVRPGYIVTRTTVHLGMTAELTTVGMPSVLVPLPGAPGDHQTANADALVAAGAAVKIPDGELDPARLASELDALLADPARLAAMSAAARALGRPDATARFADLVESRMTPRSGGGTG